MTNEHAVQEDISLVDIWNFIVDNGKKILIIGALGALAGILAHMQLGVYQASAVLTNDSNIDYVRFKKIHSNLSRVAEQKSEHLDDDFLRVASKDDWWKKNLKPVYAFTKSEMKDISELKLDENKILSFVFEVSGNTNDLAKARADKAVVFFKDAAAYIAVGELLQKYKYEVNFLNVKINKEKFEIVSEINYLKKRAANLELLKNKFPQNQASSGSQVLDPKDSGSKYLPIGTQLVAVYNEIAMREEFLERSKDEEVLLAVKSDVINSFEESTKNSFDGLKALDQTSDFIQSIIKTTQSADSNNSRKILALEKVFAEVATIKAQYQEGLGQKNSVQVTKKSVALFVLVGLLVGLMVGVGYALVSGFITRHKSEMH